MTKTTHSVIVDTIMGAARDWYEISHELGIKEHVSSHIPSHAAPINGLNCMVKKLIDDRASFGKLEDALKSLHLIMYASALEHMRSTHFPGVPASAIIADYLTCSGSAMVPIGVCAPAASAAAAPGAEPSPSPVSRSGPVRPRARTPPSETIPDYYSGYSRICRLLTHNWREVCIALGIQPVVVEAEVCTGSPPGEFARKFVDIIKQRATSLRALATAYDTVTGDSESIYAACDKR